MASIYEMGQKKVQVEKSDDELIKEVMGVLLGLPVGSCKNILKKVGEELDWVSVIQEDLLSERYNDNTSLSSNSLE